MKLNPALASLLPLALAACASSSESSVKDVNWLVTHGRYDQALRQAARDVEDDPDDPEAQEAHRRATVAYLVEQGRRATFENRDEEALVWFRRAEALDDGTIARSWIEKTDRKLASRWLDVGDQALANDELESARIAYSTAIEHEPDMPDAIRGLSQVLMMQAYREKLGEEYYQEAVRAQREWELHLARTRYEHSRKYDQGNTRTARRIGEVERELSRGRTVVAERLEQEGIYAAALIDFRQALLMDPENERAREGVARCEVEVAADLCLDQGKMALLRRDFDRARELFEEGREITESREELFEEALADIDDARVEARYQLGLVLEHDFRYEDAIEVYQSILDQREFYQDVVTRVATLRSDVAEVKELYARVEASEDPVEQLSRLREIDLIWPDYADVQARIQALQAQGVTLPSGVDEGADEGTDAAAEPGVEPAAPAAEDAAGDAAGDDTAGDDDAAAAEEEAPVSDPPAGDEGGGAPPAEDGDGR